MEIFYENMEFYGASFFIQQIAQHSKNELLWDQVDENVLYDSDDSSWDWWPWNGPANTEAPRDEEEPPSCTTCS